MDLTAMEIKLLSCKGLQAFNFFQKLSVYASVSISGDNLSPHHKQEQKTQVDDAGDGNPEWNFTMKFDLRRLQGLFDRDLFLRFVFCHRGQLFGDKVIGEVRVPMGDLIGGESDRNLKFSGEVFRFVSYEVRNPEGKSNGVLDFSYKVVRDLHQSNGGYNQPYNQVHDSKYEVHITGYSPLPHQYLHQQEQEQHQHEQLYPPSDSARIRYPVVEVPESIPTLSAPPLDCDYSSQLRPSLYPPPPRFLYPPPSLSPPPRPYEGGSSVGYPSLWPPDSQQSTGGYDSFRY